jgi:hypothetical protein
VPLGFLHHKASDNPHEIYRLGSLRDRRIGRPCRPAHAVPLRRAADVDRAIEVKVVDIVIELAHQQTGHGLIANTQDLCARAGRRYVLVAPTNFVIETEARDCCAVAVE